ncbi:V-type proton ATPase subunit C [Vanrija pseudolonga]|uniref:V-type proton ATPase subunit C n=1 Tax=Vanrija pseudolonga TaxID=143232 RepID=A0AAF0YFX9_9TREE|nr:V-type proton ATPase subunit C [Vanrija pseudolonga]
MPSDLSYWLVSVPLHDGDPTAVLQEARKAVNNTVPVGGWEIPELKAGTLSSLINLSDSLPKTDQQFTTTVSKLLETLRSLVSEDATRVAQHARVNDRPAEEYVLPDPNGNGSWQWDKRRWGDGGKVADVIEALVQEMGTVETSQKQKSQQYQLAKGALTNLQRKQQGNLSTRSLLDVVKKEHLVENSEYLETLLVAVPKNNIKSWYEKYERLTPMVVPRSSQEVAKDGEFILVTVTLFRKVRDDFINKARENKFIVRDFKWDDQGLENQNKELAQLEKEEKELWTELLRLSRINFSEAYQLLAHLKTVRLFVESVLRYGLPADYSGFVVKPEPKTAVKTLKLLSAHYNYLGSAKSREAKNVSNDDNVGEWAGVMEQEYYDFVLFELPKIQF